jgi:hypothetical protein
MLTYSHINMYAERALNTQHVVRVKGLFLVRQSFIAAWSCRRPARFWRTILRNPWYNPPIKICLYRHCCRHGKMERCGISPH